MIRRMNGNGREGGFTFIELLITLAVIALVLGVGVPMYGSFTNDSAVSGTSSTLVGTINEARSRAVAERTMMQVQSVDGDWARGWQTVRVSDGQVLQVTDRGQETAKVSIVEASGFPDVFFDREGRNVDAGGIARTLQFRIALTDIAAGTPGRQIDVNPLGRVAVTKTAPGP